MSAGAPPRLPPPLDARYHAIRQLGEGSFGVVVLAEDTHLTRLTAVKLLRDPLDDPKVAARFEREARITASLNHPSIVQVLDHGGAGNGQPYIVYEFLEGTSLADQLEGTVPLGTAVGWMIEVAEALAHAHAHDVVHRDVKPENILLRKDGRAALCDFGVAAIPSTKTVQTSGGLILGTPGYIAPEVWDGQPQGPASDQFAWAASLHEVLRGQPPYGERTLQGVARALQGGWAPDPTLPELLRRALDPDPGARFPHMQMAADALRAVEDADAWASSPAGGAGGGRATVEVRRGEAAAGTSPPDPAGASGLTLESSSAHTLEGATAGDLEGTAGADPDASGLTQAAAAVPDAAHRTQLSSPAHAGVRRPPDDAPPPDTKGSRGRALAALALASALAAGGWWAGSGPSAAGGPAPAASATPSAALAVRPDARARIARTLAEAYAELEDRLGAGGDSEMQEGERPAEYDIRLREGLLSEHTQVTWAQYLAGLREEIDAEAAGGPPVRDAATRLKQAVQVGTWMDDLWSIDLTSKSFFDQLQLGSQDGIVNDLHVRAREVQGDLRVLAGDQLKRVVEVQTRLPDDLLVLVASFFGPLQVRPPAPLLSELVLRLETSSLPRAVLLDAASRMMNYNHDVGYLPCDLKRDLFAQVEALPPAASEVDRARLQAWRLEQATFQALPCSDIGHVEEGDRQRALDALAQVEALVGSPDPAVVALAREAAAAVLLRLSRRVHEVPDFFLPVPARLRAVVAG